MSAKKITKKLNIELIIFDLDGTLVDSRKDITKAVNFTLREAGLKEKSMQEVSSFIGWGVKDLIAKSLGDGNSHLFDKSLAIFEKYYRKHATDNSILYPGAKEILEYFKDKRKVIVTNRNQEFAVLALKNLGIYDYFNDIIGADNAGCVKPSACPLDNIIEKLKISKSRVIIIGDMVIDVLAGKSAGIFTCAVTYGLGKKEDIIKSNPDYIIDDILKLKNIINTNAISKMSLRGGAEAIP
ncbi:MAG: HAD-IA family hydrolase [bacterium]